MVDIIYNFTSPCTACDQQRAAWDSFVASNNLVNASEVEVTATNNPYNVAEAPTFIIKFNGEEVERSVGVQSAAVLNRLVTTYTNMVVDDPEPDPMTTPTETNSGFGFGALILAGLVLAFLNNRN